MDPFASNGYQTTINPTYLHVFSSSQEHQDYHQSSPYATRSPGQILDMYHNSARARRGGMDLTYARELWMRQRQTMIRYPELVGAPIGSDGLIGNWGRPDPNSVMRVPVVDADPVPGGRVIEFKSFPQKTPGVRSEGTPMIGIRRKDWRTMQQAKDPTFDSSVESVMLRIQWPGYTPRIYCINNVGEKNMPLKRCELAWCVADAYYNYFMQVEGYGTLPAHIGHFNIALHQGQNARPDSLGIHFEQLHLVSVRDTARGDWIAEVDVM